MTEKLITIPVTAAIPYKLIDFSRKSNLGALMTCMTITYIPVGVSLFMDFGGSEYQVQQDDQITSLGCPSMTIRTTGTSATDSITLTCSGSPTATTPTTAVNFMRRGALVVLPTTTPVDATTTLTWTGARVIADGTVPDVDTGTKIAGARTVYIEFNTVAVTTGAPNFDLHLLASADGITYSTADLALPFAAQAKNIIAPANITVGAKYLKARMDINAANLAAAEYATLKIYVVY